MSKEWRTRKRGTTKQVGKKFLVQKKEPYSTPEMKVHTVEVKLKFELTHKDYKDEIYEAKFFYEGIPLVAIVRMHYHTIKHYWHVSYNLASGKDFQYGTPTIEGQSHIKTRKEARKIAREYMAKASSQDVEKLSKFHQNLILKREE